MNSLITILPSIGITITSRGHPPDNFGKFINQFQLETKTPTRKLERILHKLYRQNLSLLFNETCLYIYIYIYIYIFTNLISTSIHGTRKKQKKAWPGTRDKSISNHRPGEKEKNFWSKRKKRPTSPDPLKKSRDTQSVVKRKPKNPPRILQCYNY